MNVMINNSEEISFIGKTIDQLIHNSLPGEPINMAITIPWNIVIIYLICSISNGMEILMGDLGGIEQTNGAEDSRVVDGTGIILLLR